MRKPKPKARKLCGAMTTCADRSEMCDDCPLLDAFEVPLGAEVGFVEVFPVEAPVRKQRKPKVQPDVVKLGFGSEMRNWRTKGGPQTFKRPIDR